jgi:hypothetical protein
VTDYIWPSRLAPNHVTFYLQNHTAVSTSPFTRQQQVYGVGAPRFVARMAFSGGYSGEGLRGKGASLDGWLAKVKGALNTVALYDYRRPSRTGPGGLAGGVLSEVTFDQGETFLGGEVFESETATGNLAAAAGATSMTFTGADADELIFRAGDYVGGDGRAHIITEDAWGAPDGTVTVYFEPPLRTAIAADAATINRVLTAFRIQSDDAGANPTAFGDKSEYEIEFAEAIGVSAYVAPTISEAAAFGQYDFSDPDQSGLI